MSGRLVWNDRLMAMVGSAARGSGFSRVGVVDVVDVDAAPARDDEARFSEWVEAGFAGEMEYLKRRDDRGNYLRGAVRRAVPWARSVVVCAFDYSSREPRSIDLAPAGAGWIARYAQMGRVPAGERETPGAGGEGEALPSDYHDDLLVRLREVERRLQAACLAEHEVGCASRCYVDTGPIVERSLAARAGIGWVGKNTCVIDQELGSWLLLGVILTSIEAAPSVRLAPDRCGSCTRCIDACPTDALIAPRQMDASRCIAYLTIEKKGAIAEELRGAMGRQVFGCDICQDVCPWNRRSAVGADVAGALGGTVRRVEIEELSAMSATQTRPTVREELVNPPLEVLAAMDNAAFKRWFKGSPLERTGRKRLQRNVAIAMGNSGLQRFRGQLERWAGIETAGCLLDAEVSGAVGKEGSGDATVAEAARWALRALDAAVGSE